MPASRSSALLDVRWNRIGSKSRSCIAVCSPSMQRMRLATSSCLDLALTIHASPIFTLRITQCFSKRLSMQYATCWQARSLPSHILVAPIVLGANARLSWANGDFNASARHAKIHYKAETENKKGLNCLLSINNSLQWTWVLAIVQKLVHEGLQIAQKMAAIQKSEGLLNRDLGVS